MFIAFILGLVLGQPSALQPHQAPRALAKSGDVAQARPEALPLLPYDSSISIITTVEAPLELHGDANEPRHPDCATKCSLLTPMRFLEARLHLDLAYRMVVGDEPGMPILALLLAQWALETGRGGRMWGYNFGGLKASNGGTSLMTRESFGSHLRHVAQRFRTYRSAGEGARDYLQSLNRDFPRSFVALCSGSATSFVRALAEEGYFTGSEDEYRRAITQLAFEYERKLLGNPLGADANG